MTDVTSASTSVQDTSLDASPNKKMQELKRRLQQVAATATNDDHAIVADFISSGSGSRRMKITAAAAAVIVLYHDPMNRKISITKVEDLQEVIEGGDWRGTHHQGAAVDSQGHLGDGQHRLIACALSGQAIEMLVTADVPMDDILDVVDQTATRTPGQALRMRGWERGEDCGPLAAKLASYVHERQHGVKPRLSGLAVQRFAVANKQVLDESVDIGEKSVKSVTNPCLNKNEAAWVAAICMFDGWDYTQTAGFIALVQQGIAPYEKCPILVLEQKLAKSNAADNSRERLSPLTRVALTIKTANMYQQRQGSNKLEWVQKQEGLPTVRQEATAIPLAAE
jgi:hypothetical protein